MSKIIGFGNQPTETKVAEELNQKSLGIVVEDFNKAILRAMRLFYRDYSKTVTKQSEDKELSSSEKLDHIVQIYKNMRITSSLKKDVNSAIRDLNKSREEQISLEDFDLIKALQDPYGTEGFELFRRVSHRVKSTDYGTTYLNFLIRNDFRKYDENNQFFTSQKEIVENIIQSSEFNTSVKGALETITGYVPEYLKLFLGTYDEYSQDAIDTIMNHEILSSDKPTLEKVQWVKSELNSDEKVKLGMAELTAIYFVTSFLGVPESK